MPFRYDNLPLRNTERTPSGGLRIPAYLARIGIQEYVLDDGSVRKEYRPPEEVHSPRALQSFRGAPVTDGHPQGTVTAQTWRNVVRGQVGDDVRAEGEYVAAALYVQDEETIAAIERRDLVEISCGYEVDLEMVAGETANGERYDAVQRNIRGNHVALLPRGAGRAGHEVRLRVDEDKMNKEIEELRIKAEKVREDLHKELEVAKQRADAAEKRVLELEQQLKDLPRQLKRRREFEAQVRRLDAKVQLDNRSELDVLKEILSGMYKLDGSETEDYLRGLLTAHFQIQDKTKTETIKVEQPESAPVRVPWQPFVQ